jgi:uncharacterized protein DUF4124
MIRTRALLVAASLLALFIAPTVRGEIYKWVDEKGVVNYGTTPPPGKPVKQLPVDAPGVTVVPADHLPPPPPPTTKSPVDERVEKLEKALEAEKSARESQKQREEERRRAAIAQCEANRGVDCAQDPYQQMDGGFVVPRRAILRPHPIPSPPPLHKPPPPEKPKPAKPMRPATPERDAPAAGQPYHSPRN